MLTAVPARIMGLEAGKIEAGLLADIVVLEEALTARHVFVGGEKVL